MTDTEANAERIAKVMARAGLCSRRDAERWIEDGRVSVDGEVLSSPARTVTRNSVVLVDGKPLPAAAEPRLWRYHKPRGLVTTHKDPEGRETVFTAIAKSHPALGRLISVGRLDINSEGLLLLTNSGELARALETPKNAWVRRYRVRVNGQLDEKKLAALKDGITISGIRYGSIDARLESRKGANTWVSVALTEGKNREIRNVMEHLGLQVSRLIRISYGPLHLGQLERGNIHAVPKKTMLDQIGAFIPGLAQIDGGAETKNPERKGWAKAKPKRSLAHTKSAKGPARAKRTSRKPK